MSEPRKREEKIGPSLYVERGAGEGWSGEGGGMEEKSRRWRRANKRRIVDGRKGEEKSRDGEKRSGRKIESARKTKR